MQRTYCDKCGIEAKRPYRIGFTIKNNEVQNTFVKEYCDACWKAVREVMG